MKEEMKELKGKNVVETITIIIHTVVEKLKTPMSCQRLAICYFTCGSAHHSHDLAFTNESCQGSAA